MITTLEQFLEALARTESVNDPCALGDYDSNHIPHAVGRWQIHADRLITLAHGYSIWPRLGESYDSWHRRLITAMYNEHAGQKSALRIACFWHRGHWLDPSEDQEYAARFLGYCPEGTEV